ncbi:hypothetical protein LIA77_12012 [Sarocladium implicatum]|nr:hypothetical protein LIA77_12012 [Sarocladium implicatum]
MQRSRAGQAKQRYVKVTVTVTAIRIPMRRGYISSHEPRGEIEPVKDSLDDVDEEDDEIFPHYWYVVHGLRKRVSAAYCRKVDGPRMSTSSASSTYSSYSHTQSIAPSSHDDASQDARCNNHRTWSC